MAYDAYIEERFWDGGRGPAKPTLVITADALCEILIDHCEELVPTDAVDLVVMAIAQAARAHEATESDQAILFEDIAAEYALDEDTEP
jgi:hypothetical protein